MRYINQHKMESLTETQNSDYLRGYRDGIRDGRSSSRSPSADGLLGALLAISLMAGIGYLGYQYATTGQILPGGVEIHNPLQEPNTSQP